MEFILRGVAAVMVRKQARQRRKNGHKKRSGPEILPGPPFFISAASVHAKSSLHFFAAASLTHAGGSMLFRCAFGNALSIYVRVAANQGDKRPWFCRLAKRRQGNFHPIIFQLYQI